MGYYDIDDIISDGQRVPTKFNITVPGLGYLEGNPGKSILEGSKLELPLWIAEVLAVCGISETSSTAFIELIQPEALSKKVLNAIKTSPVTLDVHSISQHYYALVDKWGKLFSDKELIEIVQQMLKERSEEINNHAQNLRGVQQESNFLFSLDEFEKKLYRISHESYKDFRKWMHNETH